MSVYVKSHLRKGRRVRAHIRKNYELDAAVKSYIRKSADYSNAMDRLRGRENASGLQRGVTFAHRKVEKIFKKHYPSKQIIPDLWFRLGKKRR